ncbi:MAG: hypothetical protein RJA63_366 [Pseudomonadota bacterium]|jgi:hypothetical protein
MPITLRLNTCVGAVILASMSLATGVVMAADADAPAAKQIIDFTGDAATAQGGVIGNVVYSQSPDDAALKSKTFADGALKVVGQVGFGKSSKWAGMGITTSIGPSGTQIDANSFKTISFKLAASEPVKLRVRIIGNEQAINDAGCYPIVMQAVTTELTEYTVPLASFASEGWCGGKARSVNKTLSGFTGFEVVNIDMTGKETSFTLGSVRLNP